MVVSIDKAFMAIYSPLRSRRLAAQQTEATQRLLTFQLCEETFALPLDRVHKAIALDTLGERRGQRLYGDPHRTGVSLTTYQGRELVVIDVGYQIFGKTQSRLPATEDQSNSVAATQTQGKIGYLLILQPEPDRLIDCPSNHRQSSNRFSFQLLNRCRIFINNTVIFTVSVPCRSICPIAHQSFY